MHALHKRNAIRLGSEEAVHLPRHTCRVLLSVQSMVTATLVAEEYMFNSPIQSLLPAGMHSMAGWSHSFIAISHLSVCLGSKN